MSAHISASQAVHPPSRSSIQREPILYQDGHSAHNMSLLRFMYRFVMVSADEITEILTSQFGPLEGVVVMRYPANQEVWIEIVVDSWRVRFVGVG